MAGLGLSNAVRLGIDAMRQREAMDDRARQRQMQEEDRARRRQIEDEENARQRDLRAKIDEANKAFAGTIEESKAKWALNGAQGEYRPNEETLFKAAEARGAALAKAGLWDEFIANEAKVAPMRGATRQRAVQRFEMDGDGEALARAIYPTLFDGKQLVAVKRNDGGGTGPQALDLEMSDGSRMTLGVDQLYKMAKVGADPEALKREALLNFERAKADIYVKREKDVAAARGDEAIRVDNARSGNQTGLATLNNASRERIAEGRNEAIKAQAHGRERQATGGGRRAPADPDVAPVPMPQPLGDGLTLLPDAQPAQEPPAAERVMGAAKREAAMTRKPVEFNIGGQTGMITRDGGLADAQATTKATGKAASKAPAGKPEAKPAPGPKKPDMAAAERVRADFRAGKLTRDQAKQKLRELGFN